jgi:predicted amidohydrolase YtcJ
VLRTYQKYLNDKPNRRWRVEHAQVLDPSEYSYFSKNILPSVQPTHATSDMYWAEDRLGEERVKHAYAYKRLLEEAEILPLGTDFPVEKVNPMLTFYAAVSRQDTEGFPENGFQSQNALTREETLKGMTIWAAYGAFEEDEKGSLEPGKYADFIIFDEDLMTVDIEKVPELKVQSTYINGELVYENK